MQPHTELELNNFDKELTCALILWLVSHDDFIHSQLLPFRSLANWLVPYESIAAAYSHLPHEINKETAYFPSGTAQDICGNCYSIFGNTVGGRIRQGCIHCKEDVSYPTKSFYTLRDILYLSNAHIEYVFAKALNIWATARQPNKGRYPNGHATEKV